MTEDLWNGLKSHSNTLVGFTVGLTAGLFARSGAVKWLRLLVRAGPSSLTGESRKMVIVVRSDISMSAGKVAAQCAHAAVGCFSKSFEAHPKEVLPWMAQGQPKIVLRGGPGGDSSLIQLHNKATKNGLVSSLIRDAGKTEVKRGTYTALGIGPAPVSQIDKVTGHLRTL